MISIGQSIEESKQMWPIFIVTLPGAEERRERLEMTLQTLDLDYDIFVGVDARNGVPKEWQDSIDFERAQKVMGRPLSSPEIGCALSHLLLSRKILENELPGAIVFEDDAIIAEGDYFAEFMNAKVYETGELIQLSYGPARIWRLGIGEDRPSRRLSTERLVHNAGLTTAYSISRRGADYLIENAFPLRCVADWPCDLKPIRPRIIRPRLVGRPPQGVSSTIDDERKKAKLIRQVSSKKYMGERRNPLPRGYRFFHRFLSKTIF